MKDYRRNSRVSKRQRKKQADQTKAERIEEIEEYLEATKTNPDYGFRVYEHYSTYIDHPDNVRVVRQALIDALEGMKR